MVVIPVTPLRAPELMISPFMVLVEVGAVMAPLEVRVPTMAVPEMLRLPVWAVPGVEAWSWT